LVETLITWRKETAGRRRTGASATFSTLGVDSDQLGAAVIASEKMLNAVAPNPAKEARTRSLKAVSATVKTEKSAKRGRARAS
jgi:hypothetical protein